MFRNWHAHYFEEVSSTMDVAHELVHKKALSPLDGLVILASAQTSGRGRYNRQWNSPQGNFYGSFAFLPQLNESTFPLYSFAVAMALFDAINQVIDQGDLLKVKWPNDLLFKGKKIAGILLELSDTQPKHLIVGIGVNLTSTPVHTPYPATDLHAEMQRSPAAEDFMPQFLPHLTTTLDLLETRGFAPIRQAWLEARYPQDEICITVHQKVKRGTFVDLDIDGQLILKEAQTNKTIKIAGGDLYF